MSYHGGCKAGLPRNMGHRKHKKRVVAADGTEVEYASNTLLSVYQKPFRAYERGRGLPATAQVGERYQMIVPCFEAQAGQLGLYRHRWQWGTVAYLDPKGYWAMLEMDEGWRECFPLTPPTEKLARTYDPNPNGTQIHLDKDPYYYMIGREKRSAAQKARWARRKEQDHEEK
ncbi:MAG: hypothetical protein LUE89_07430 [Clostridiales bacterium]|nr:hypothetical protein [Clostridiales bacterium]